MLLPALVRSPWKKNRFLVTMGLHWFQIIERLFSILSVCSQPACLFWVLRLLFSKVVSHLCKWLVEYKIIIYRNTLQDCDNNTRVSLHITTNPQQWDALRDSSGDVRCLHQQLLNKPGNSQTSACRIREGAAFNFKTSRLLALLTVDHLMLFGRHINPFWDT